MSEAKTIALTGGEEQVQFRGANAWLRNDGTGTIYAAKSAGVTAGADGVVGIPAGSSAPVYGANGTVYLLGTGSVMLVGSDYSTNPFKLSASSGGSGADEVARAAVSAHESNTDIHVTAQEKAEWSAVNYSSRNLLDNPDFLVNQRGLTEYSAGVSFAYTLDRWIICRANVSVVDGGISAAWNGTDASNGWIQQHIENAAAFAGLTITVSALIDGEIIAGTTTVPAEVNGSSTAVSNGAIKISVGHYSNNRLGVAIVLSSAEPCVIGWVKAEIGAAATQFLPPNPAEEFAKCQRYYQIRSTNSIDPVDLRPSMATITDIKQREDGNYEYIAEL